MGKKTPSAPAAPDPAATAAAQTQSNIATAQNNAALNRVSQVTPYGNLTYSQNGSDPNSWTATQTMSPAEQANYNLSTQAQNLYGTTALNQLGQASGALSNPVDTNLADYQQQLPGMQNAANAANTPTNTDFSAERNQYINSQMGLIQPKLDQQQQTLQSQLANQGVAQGSTAYQNAQRDYNNSANSMYANILANAQTGVTQDIANQGALALQPSQTAAAYGNLAAQQANLTGSTIQQQAALRAQPLNEASALLSGSQVQAPSFTNVPQTQVQGTDIAGITNSAYQNQNAAYQNALANQSSAYGGIGSLVGMLGSAAIMSDKRVKTDIHEVGSLDHPGGDLPIKTFRYKGDPQKHLGFIAQDVERVQPGAVVTHPASGIKGVNYAHVLMKMGQTSRKAA